MNELEREIRIAKLEAENKYLNELVFVYKSLLYKSKPKAVQLLEARYGHLLQKEELNHE